MTDPYDQDQDILERSDALDREIWAIPADKVFTKRRVTAGFVVLAGLQIASTLTLGLMLLGVTSSTNEAVRHEVPGLKEQIADRDATIDGATSAITQLTDALVASQQQVRDLGGTPADVVIRTDEEPAG